MVLLRNLWLALLLSFAASQAWSASLTLDKNRTDLTRQSRPLGDSYQGPIIDTHVHVFSRSGSLSVDDIFEKVDGTGVERLIVLPTPNDGRMLERGKIDGHTAALRREIGAMNDGRGGRICGSDYFTSWMNDNWRKGFNKADLDKRLTRLRDELTDGGCLAIGEIGPTHFAKKPGQHVIHFPMDSEPMLALADLAAELKVPLDIHAEPVTPGGQSYEDEVFTGIAALFKRQPKLRLILAHTAMTNPNTLRALFEAYPTLIVNLKMVKPGSKLQWNNLEPISNTASELFEDWAKLMEDMPRRFMIGTDSRFGERQYRDDRYQRGIKLLRRVLGGLDKAAADLIAHGNARRVFGGQTALNEETDKDHKKKKRDGKKRDGKKKRRE